MSSPGFLLLIYIYLIQKSSFLVWEGEFSLFYPLVTEWGEGGGGERPKMTPQDFRKDTTSVLS